MKKKSKVIKLKHYAHKNKQSILGDFFKFTIFLRKITIKRRLFHFVSSCFTLFQIFHRKENFKLINIKYYYYVFET